MSNVKSVRKIAKINAGPRADFVVNANLNLFAAGGKDLRNALNAVLAHIEGVEAMDCPVDPVVLKELRVIRGEIKRRADNRAAKGKRPLRKAA